MRVQLYQSGRLALTRLLEAGAGILAQSRECIANRRDVMLFAKRICKVIRASGGVVYFVKGQTTTRAGMQERKLTADPCQPQAPPYLPCPVSPPFAFVVQLVLLPSIRLAFDPVQRVFNQADMAT